MELQEIYQKIGISPEVYEYGEKILSGLRARFEAIDQTAEYNQAKVLAAMQETESLVQNRVQMGVRVEGKRNS